MWGERVWERKREELTFYRRRTPEKTPLYRIVYRERDNLPRLWEECFQQKYGVLRNEVLETLDAYLNCGILAHGVARAECESCKHSIVIAFSCKKRGVCPSCAAKRAVIFAEHLHDKVLAPVPQRHIVFSIPKRLRVFFRYDRSLNSILFHAAWESLVALHPHGKPGAVLALQSAGESLNFNPHLHGIVSAGSFNKEGLFIEQSLDTSKATELFAHGVLAALKEKGLIDEAVIEQILSQAHTGFSAWVGEKIPPQDAGYRLFLGRYLDRGPVSNAKLIITDDIISLETDLPPKKWTHFRGKIRLKFKDSPAL